MKEHYFIWVLIVTAVAVLPGFLGWAYYLIKAILNLFSPA